MAGTTIAMDLSFALNKPERTAQTAVTMADIIATAAVRREAFSRELDLVAILRGQEEAEDSVQALARLLVADACGPVETASLGGSFNPLVAGQNGVGDVE